MARQTTTAAGRKLKNARDLVETLRRDADAVDEGVRWIERGDWQARLGRRDAGGVCREVVTGFEDVCRAWRDTLVSRADAQLAPGRDPEPVPA